MEAAIKIAFLMAIDNSIKMRPPSPCHIHYEKNKKLTTAIKLRWGGAKALMALYNNFCGFPKPVWIFLWIKNSIGKISDANKKFEFA